MRNQLPVGFVLAASLALFSPANASVFVTSTGGYAASEGNINGGLRDGYSTSFDYAGTLGYTFTVGPSNLLVTGLGYYDGPNSHAANVPGYLGDGLNNAHEVGIWDTTSSLLASAPVPSGTAATLIDEFRYVPITPITLLAGTSYTVGGQVTVLDNTGGALGDVFRNGGAGTFGPGIASVSGGPSYSGPPVNPTFADGVFQAPNSIGSGYFGGSFQYAVPEPASFVLCGLGAVGLLVAARRRRKA